MESQQRRSNLQFLGIPEDRDEAPEEVILRLCAQQGLHFDDRTIERAHRLGKYSRHRARAIIVRFNHYKDRQLVMEKKSHLKKNHKVRVDFPQEIAARRRKLYPIVDAAYNYRDPLNDTFRYKAKIVVDRLILNGSVYTVENLASLPEHLRPENISTPSNVNTVVFFSSSSPLSNHYPCNFECKSTVAWNNLSCLRKLCYSKRQTQLVN